MQTFTLISTYKIYMAIPKSAIYHASAVFALRLARDNLGCLVSLRGHLQKPKITFGLKEQK